MSQPFLKTSDNFIALMEDESPSALDVPVVVSGHTWCSLGSVVMINRLTSTLTMTT
jgi:hypothetical protein